MTVIAVFRSRSQSLDYADNLNKFGVVAETVSTPKEANVGCGLCVKFDARYFVRANALLKRGRYTSFKGFYKVDYSTGKLALVPYGE